LNHFTVPLATLMLLVTGSEDPCLPLDHVAAPSGHCDRCLVRLGVRSPQKKPPAKSLAVLNADHSSTHNRRQGSYRASGSGKPVLSSGAPPNLPIRGQVPA